MAFVERCSRGDMLTRQTANCRDDIALFANAHTVLSIPDQPHRRIYRGLTTRASIRLDQLQLPQIPPIHLMRILDPTRLEPFLIPQWGKEHGVRMLLRDGRYSRQTQMIVVIM